MDIQLGFDAIDMGLTVSFQMMGHAVMRQNTPHTAIAYERL
jgi:hypothetical protein